MALTVEDQLAIQKLYADYCFAIDDGDGPGFAGCFTADGSLDAGYGDPTVGTEALVAFCEATAQLVPGIRHVVTNVTVSGDADTATGRAYISVYRVGTAGHENILTGRYVDTLREADGAWRFVARVMTQDTPPA